MEKDKLWQEFLNQIVNKISTVSFNTWFKDLKLLTVTSEDIILSTLYSVQKDHILENYLEEIEEIFLNITGSIHNVIICLDGEYTEKQEVEVSSVINEDKVSKETEIKKTNLNPKYTFDNFVVGDSNIYAYKSCLSVAQNPGKLYNPLFLYGKSGLGKTHLMHAIGNYIIENSNLKVLYTTTDEFMNEFVTMTKDVGDKDANLNYIDLFKSKYRDIDVLMIDDIQFLGNANATQQEFTNTFNDLYYKDKQIIICSDRSVDDLKMFADRLKTRFNWGLKAIIDVPNYELKVKIIRNKINYYRLDLNEDIINYIAANCGSDVRNLEGAITRLSAYSAMFNIGELTLENAYEALVEYTNNMVYTDNSVKKIMSVTANYFKLTVDDLISKRRSKDIANARMIAMYLCRRKTDETYPRIGLEFGGRDHSTVIHAYEKISEDIKKNPELDKVISEIIVKLSE